MNKSTMLLAVLIGALTSGVATSQTRSIKVHATSAEVRVNDQQLKEKSRSKVLNDSTQDRRNEQHHWDQAPPRDENLPQAVRLQAA